MMALAGESSICCNVAAPTTKFALSVKLPRLAEISEVPTALLIARPLVEMVAMLGLLDSHWTVALTS